MKRVAAGLLLLLSACASTTTTSSTPLQVGTSTGPSARAGSGGPSTGPGAGRPGGGGPTAGGYFFTPGPLPSGGGRYTPPAQDPDMGQLGTLARGIMRPSPYTRVAMEIDVGGTAAAPTAKERSTLRSVIGTTTGKTATDVGGRSFPGRGSGCWSDADLRSLAAGGRTAHTGGDTVALDFIFLDASSCDSVNILGLAYGATTVAIFTQQVNKLGTATVPASLFVQSVATHEFGHLCGLVNLVYRSHIAHEDPQHPGHSKNPNSVMYYAIEQGNLLQQFVSGPPTAFDSDDKADLAGLADGTY